MTCDPRIALDCSQCNRPYCPHLDSDDDDVLLPLEPDDGWDD